MGVVGRISLFSVSLYNVALSFDVQRTISFPLECNKSPFGYGSDGNSSLLQAFDGHYSFNRP